MLESDVPSGLTPRTTGAGASKEKHVGRHLPGERGGQVPSADLPSGVVERPAVVPSSDVPSGAPRHLPGERGGQMPSTDVPSGAADPTALVTSSDVRSGLAPRATGAGTPKEEHVERHLPGERGG